MADRHSAKELSFTAQHAWRVSQISSKSRAHRLHRGNSCSLVSLVFCLMLCACGGGPQCAPYARTVTGFPLFGPAAGWWQESSDRLAHSSVPKPGAVLVLRATRRLPYGHVSVVRRVLGPREILVEHANWEPGQIDRSVPVLDVSSGNDWSLVRVWWHPSHSIGRSSYAACGFILPKIPPHPIRAARFVHS